MTDSQMIALLKPVQTAWKNTCKDYDSFALNSERCLQAALYFHLRSALPKREGYVIFIEATVHLPAVASDKTTETVVSEAKRVAIDTLICKGDEILIAMELKYTPRGFPTQAGISKDLLSLSHIRNHAAKARRVEIEISRHRETSIGNEKVLTISPQAKMLLGILCREPTGGMQDRVFWERHAPVEGPWAQRARSLPPRLGLCLGYASTPGSGIKARPRFVGQPFADIV